MIQRAIVHVAGPAGSGKTAFVEAMLGGADEFILVARGVRDDSLRRSRETRPKADPELRRYRRAGASGVARFAFPRGDIGSDEFFMTDLMSDYSRAVVLEGDNPVGFVGTRTPITAVVANLADPADPGCRKALARVRRCVRSVSA